MTPGQGWLRFLRGGVLAACSVALGLFGHLLGGGSASVEEMSAPTLVAALIIGAGSVAWAHRRRGFAQLLAAAAVAQLAFHVTLSLAPAHLAGHHHPAPPAVSLDLRMLVGHALACAALAWVLARGEASLWALSVALGRLLIAPRRAAVFAPAHRVGLEVIRVPDNLVRTALLVVAAQPRRGPPGLAPA